MPSSRAPVLKSLDVRRRTLAPHSGEAASASGRKPASASQMKAACSQPARAIRVRLPPWFTSLLHFIHTSHFLACHQPLLQSFTRHHPHGPHLPIQHYFISHRPATRACDRRCYALRGLALACTLACIYATKLLSFRPSVSSTSPTRRLAVRLHQHSHVQLRG